MNVFMNMVMRLPLLQTLWLSRGPLESLSLSSAGWCRCRLPGVTLRSRGPGLGERPSSLPSRPPPPELWWWSGWWWRAAAAAPPPPPLPARMSVIMKRDRGGCSTAIEPRCTGTVMSAPAMSDMPLILVAGNGLPPDVNHCSTILTQLLCHSGKKVSGTLCHFVTEFLVKIVPCFRDCPFWLTGSCC